MKTSIVLPIGMAFLALLQMPGATYAGTVSVNVFASGTSVGASSPDSVDVSGGSVWVAYTNGASSIGSSGSSTIVQYGPTGSVLNTYTISGYVDGLRTDPTTGAIWALQNQDGNSALTVIDPVAKTLTPLTYAVTSTTRGYDDAAFVGGQVFMSNTNPAAPTDSTIVQLTNSTSPLTVSPVLQMGALGTNLATGQTNQPTSQSDPDSLVVNPNGGLILSSGADGQLIFVNNPGIPSQAVSFLQLLSGGSNVSGLDDSAVVTSSSGTFYLADTSNNRILDIQVSGLTPGSLYASVGSLNALVSVDMSTGNVTPLVSGLNGPHGLAFVAAPEPATLALFGSGLLVVLGIRRRRG